MKSIYVIVLAGAPASGKSSVLKRLKEMTTNENFKVIFLDEMATVFLHNRPAAVCALDSQLLRQHYILKSQLHLEDQILEYAADAEKMTLMITDRGAIDAMVYLSDDDYQKLGVDADKLFSRYDFVIFLEGIEDNYVPNDATTTRVEENYDEIKAISKKTLEVYKKHKSLSLIYQQETIEDKAKKVGETINELVGAEVFVML